MSNSIPESFSDITAVCKANIYHNGGVVSHTLLFPDGSKKTLGIIFPGTYRFDTQAPERMEMTDGTVQYRLHGAGDWITYSQGDTFNIPGDTWFEIAVQSDVAQYICSFL